LRALLFDPFQTFDGRLRVGLPPKIHCELFDASGLNAGAPRRDRYQTIPRQMLTKPFVPTLYLGIREMRETRMERE
jgi:hypothetical protein